MLDLSGVIGCLEIFVEKSGAKFAKIKTVQLSIIDLKVKETVVYSCG